VTWNTWERYAEDAIQRHPGKVAAILKRLAAEHGLQAVGEAVAMVYTSRDEELILPIKANDYRARAKALERLDQAVRGALAAPTDRVRGDESLQRWLSAGLPMIAAAAKAPRGNRLNARTNLGLDSRSLVAEFQRLGASKHEAGALVSGLTPPPGDSLRLSGTK